MNLIIQPLSPLIGATISGLEIHKITDKERAVIDKALLEYQVLFFRNQPLTPSQHAKLASRFGQLHIHPIYPQVKEQPEILVLDTAVTDVKDNAVWHTDVTFIETPPMGAWLSAKEVPICGGDTLWSSGYAAFNALSTPLQHLLKDLTATHDFAHSFPQNRYASHPNDQPKWLQAQRDHPPVSHPVIRTHPQTGRKALFVNESFTTRINELEESESKHLLAFLFQHITKPEFSVRWQWQKNDLAFWDNRVTQHYAVNDYQDARRVMHRATILGDRPH